MPIIKFDNRSNEEKEIQESKRLREVERSIQEQSIERERKIRNYNNKKKRHVSYIIIGSAVTILALIIFGTYNTFIKKDIPVNQLAYQINQLNGDTPFPEYGVEGFLKQNINKLFKEISQTTKNIETFKVREDSLLVTELYKKSKDIANVFFVAKVESKLPDSNHEGQIIPGAVTANEYSFFITLHYDYSKGFYQPASQLQILAYRTENETNIIKDGNLYLSFDNIEKYAQSSNEYATVKIFIDNFLKNIYNNNVDVSLEYSGNFKLGDKNLTYDSISNLDYYQGYNKEKFNLIVQYNLLTSDGLKIANQSYFRVEPNGDSFKVSKFR